MKQRKLLFAAAILLVFVFIFCNLFLKKTEISREEPSGKEEKFKLAIVLDDFGYNKRNLNALKDLNIPVTLAVLPHTPYSEDVCKFAENNGLEIILHLPMQPEGDNEPVERSTIRVDMDEDTVRNLVREALDSVPLAGGISSHMGSKATKDVRLMRIVFEVLKEREMFFLDSFTSSDTVCSEAAKKTGVPYLKRDIFIDNLKDAGYIQERLRELVKLKDIRKQAIGIGHDRAVTINALKETVPQIIESGASFVRLSDLIKKRI